MTLALGSTQINKMYLGTTEVTKCYLGDTQVYEKPTAPVGEVWEVSLQTYQCLKNARL